MVIASPSAGRSEFDRQLTVRGTLACESRKQIDPQGVLITDALSIVGDRYALLVARELRFVVVRFQDIAASTGAPRDVLTARLRKLELAGVIERRRYCEHPPRYEYLLTEAGRELQPILLALKEWGDRHCTPAPSPSSSSTPAALTSTR
jgi:DNA-binding HxlR family transcriptional regulator